MPYEVLDAIERAAIRDKQLPLETFRLMRSSFPEYSEWTDSLLRQHWWIHELRRRPWAQTRTGSYRSPRRNMPSMSCAP